MTDVIDRPEVETEALILDAADFALAREQAAARGVTLRPASGGSCTGRFGARRLFLSRRFRHARLQVPRGVSPGLAIRQLVE
jgi:hypothetical protein